MNIYFQTQELKLFIGNGSKYKFLVIKLIIRLPKVIRKSKNEKKRWKRTEKCQGKRILCVSTLGFKWENSPTISNLAMFLVQA